jgi:lysozyme
MNRLTLSLSILLSLGTSFIFVNAWGTDNMRLPIHQHKSTPKTTRLIEAFEGFRSDAYTCSGGKLTIGFGHVITPNEKENLTKPINRDQGIKLLEADLQRVVLQRFPSFVKVPLHPWEYDALVSFTFNLGIENLGKSDLLKYTNEGNYDKASLGFPNWRSAGGKYVPGLLKRRWIEMLIFRNSTEMPSGLDEQTLQLYGELNGSLKNEIVQVYQAYQRQ